MENSRLHTKPVLLMAYNALQVWNFCEPPRGHTFSVEQQELFKVASNMLSSYCTLDSANFRICINALLERCFGSKSKGAHEKLMIGDVIQVLLTDTLKRNMFLDSVKSTKGTPRFFVIGVFLQVAVRGGWAVVKECKPVSTDSISQLPDPKGKPLLDVHTADFYSSQESIHFIELSEMIRKVGYIHNCGHNNTCQFLHDSRRVKHSCSTLDRGRFFLLTRSMGYPPRRSWTSRGSCIVMHINIQIYIHLQ